MYAIMFLNAMIAPAKAFSDQELTKMKMNYQIRIKRIRNSYNHDENFVQNYSLERDFRESLCAYWEILRHDERNHNYVNGLTRIHFLSAFSLVYDSFSHNFPIENDCLALAST